MTPPRTGLSVYAAIAAGSVLGSLLRWSAGQILPIWFGKTFPWDTLFINISGSFLICYFAARFPNADRRVAHFMMTGVCGGFTTFSLFSLELFNLTRFNEYATALGYVGLTIAGTLGAAWFGTALGARRPT